MSKKYLVFFGPKYYPKGGIEDYVGSYKTLQEAISAVKQLLADTADEKTFFQIYNSVTQKQENIKL